MCGESVTHRRISIPAFRGSASNGGGAAGSYLRTLPERLNLSAHRAAEPQDVISTFNEEFNYSARQMAEPQEVILILNVEFHYSEHRAASSDQIKRKNTLSGLAA